MARVSARRSAAPTPPHSTEARADGSLRSEGDVSALLDDVQEAARALPHLGEEAATLWPKVSAALAATAEDAERRLTRERVGVLVVGAPEATRALFHAALGEDLFGARGAVVVRVRRADTPRWMARRADGSVFQIDPDRSKELAAALAKRETEARDARAALERLRREIAELRAALVPSRDATATVPAIRAGALRRAAFAWRRALAWLVALVVAWLTAARILRRREPPDRDVDARTMAARVDAVVPLERATLDGEAKTARADAEVARARAELESWMAARRASFLEDVRAIAAGERGAVELLVEHPSDVLADDLVLVDAPLAIGDDDAVRDDVWSRVRAEVGGCLALGGTGDERVARLAPIVPHVLPSGRDDARPILDRLRREVRVGASALAAGDVRARLQSFCRASARAEEEIRERIAAVERDRVPPPDRFREEQMTRMRPIVDEAARRVIASAVDALKKELAAIEAEWTKEIEACGGRAEVEACVARINQGAEPRLAALVERVVERVAREMQSTSETLQGWVLDEMSVRYKTLSAQLEPRAVILSDVPEDVPSLRDAPLPQVMRSFEQRRVDIGLGGVAAGAALGTLILPGIGTAVGALVGVFAGFLEGVAPLKRESIARVHTHLGSVERDVAARLGGSPGFARDLCISLEEALDAALRAQNDAIVQLVEMEKEVLARENERLAAVVALRAKLEAHEARFASLATAAATALRDLAAARPRPPRVPAADASLGA